MADGNFGGNNNQPTRDRHAIGHYASHLLAEVQPTATKQPRLSVYYHKNKLSIEVRTNVPADMNGRERGIIRAELEPPAFFTLLAALKRIIDNPNNDVRQSMKVKRPDFQKNNGGEPVMDCQVVYGKDKNGVVFISLLSANKERPRIMFPFHPGKWVEFVGQDGSPISDAELSLIYAEGKLTEWEEMAPKYMYDRFVQEEFGDKRGGGNQGGGGGQQYGQRQNYGGGGGDMRTESKPVETETWENLPF